jgi:hypothetical protein
VVVSQRLKAISKPFVARTTKIGESCSAVAIIFQVLRREASDQRGLVHKRLLMFFSYCILRPSTNGVISYLSIHHRDVQSSHPFTRFEFRRVHPTTRFYHKSPVMLFPWQSSFLRIHFPYSSCLFFSQSW